MPLLEYLEYGQEIQKFVDPKTLSAMDSVKTLVTQSICDYDVIEHLRAFPALESLSIMTLTGSGLLTLRTAPNPPPRLNTVQRVVLGLRSKGDFYDYRDIEAEAWPLGELFPQVKTLCLHIDNEHVQPQKVCSQGTVRGNADQFRRYIWT